MPLPYPPATYLILYYHYAFSYLALTGGCTLIVTYFLYRYGVDPIVVLVRFKLLITVLFAYIHYRRQQRNRTFWYNFGLSQRWLLTPTVALDLLVCCAVMVATL